MIPKDVQAMLDEYKEQVQTSLPDLITGFYLHGSLALNAFNPGLSDVDFIAVVSRRLTESDLACLTRIHDTLADKYPNAPLQGSYLQVTDLGKFPHQVEPTPYYSDGVLSPAGYHDLNSITWWLLKHGGITLLGTQAESLPFSVDWQLLLANTKANLNNYWGKYITRPAHIAWLFSDYGIQWVVLGVLRQWYTFEKNSITSKVEAGEYALKQLPARWHKIIQEALGIRYTKPSLYRWRLLRTIEAWLFLRFIINYCNANYRF